MKIKPKSGVYAIIYNKYYLTTSWFKVGWDGHRFPITVCSFFTHHNFITSHLSRQIMNMLNILK